jgi:hypothetical protein
MFSSFSASLSVFATGRKRPDSELYKRSRLITCAQNRRCGCLAVKYGSSTEPVREDTSSAQVLGVVSVVAIIRGSPSAILSFDGSLKDALVPPGCRSSTTNKSP